MNANPIAVGVSFFGLLLLGLFAAIVIAGIVVVIRAIFGKNKSTSSGGTVLMVVIGMLVLFGVLAVFSLVGYQQQREVARRSELAARLREHGEALHAAHAARSGAKIRAAEPARSSSIEPGQAGAPSDSASGSSVIELPHEESFILHEGNHYDHVHSHASVHYRVDSTLLLWAGVPLIAAVLVLVSIFVFRGKEPIAPAAEVAPPPVYQTEYAPSAPRSSSGANWLAWLFVGPLLLVFGFVAVVFWARVASVRRDFAPTPAVAIAVTSSDGEGVFHPGVFGVSPNEVRELPVAVQGEPKFTPGPFGVEPSRAVAENKSPALPAIPAQEPIAATTQPVTPAAPAQAQAATPPSQPQPVAPTPAVAPPVAEPLPAWVNNATHDDGQYMQFVVQSEQYATVAEAENAALKVAADEIEFRLRLSGFVGDWSLPERMVRSDAVTRRHVEQITRRSGEHQFVVHRVYLLVQANSDFRDQARMIWKSQVGTARLWTVGILIGAVAYLIAVVAGYLRIDALSQGRYRGRLRLAAILLIASAGIVCSVVS